MTLLADTEPADPFYRVMPADLQGEHGDLIRVKDFIGPAALTGGSANSLVIYQSERVADGGPIGVSGIVVLPKGDPPPGGWPVVSWAHGTVGVADKGAPSLDSDDLADITDPSNPPLTVTRKINRAPQPMLNEFLRRGWAVVMTDYEGLGTRGPHPYLFGYSEGRGTLDIVRAARHLHNRDRKPGEEVLSNDLIIVGHSQGGQAALFAAHLVPTWTPELQLRGVAAIAPASAQTSMLMLALLPAGPNVAFLAMTIAGALASSPGIESELVNKVFTARGLQLFRDSIDNLVRTELSEPNSWGAEPGRKYFRIFTRKPGLTAALKGMHPDLEIGAPIRISQAVKDPRVRFKGTVKLRKQLEKRNGSVDWVQYEHTAEPDPATLAEHFGILETDLVPVADWIGRRFGSV